ncbi:MAG: 30S ribosomal protein S2 [Phycisphaerae bacterium]|nr:30S ribosomal protein S2 [Phycisphaerae bacterium]
MSKELARDLIGAGVHFGHGVSRWNPKMAPYIFGKRSKIHIINVKETLKGLLISKKLLANVVSSGKDVVFVGTKRQAQKPVQMIAAKTDMHYVSERWLGGMLTNFQTIRSQLKRLEELEAMDKSGMLAKESKKQEARLKREMRKISTNLGGVRNMNRLPGAVIVIDTNKEHLALREAKKLGIVTIGIIDTDSDPDEVDVVIPANDDSIKAIEIILGQLGQAVAYGKTQFTPAGGPGGAPKGRSRRESLASAGGGKKPKAPGVKPAPRAIKTDEDAPAAPAAAPEAPAAAPEAPAAPETPAAPEAPAGE